MSRPKRVALVRSGRHLHVAVAVLRRRYPACQITVIATPGTDAARRQAGIDERDWIVYDAHPRFDAWPMLVSGIAARVWTRRCDHVAVLWQDPTGGDRANVDRTARVLSPSGFAAITPDGTLIERRSIDTLRRQAVNAVMSAATAIVLGVALYAPAAIAAFIHGRRSAGSR